MADKFSPSQVQTVARYITGIMENVIQPLYRECLAQEDVLNQMKSYDAAIQTTVDTALTAARANPQTRQKADQVYRLALEKSLQQIFGYSQDAEVLKQVRKDLGLVN